MSDFFAEWKNNSAYFETLQMLAGLSGLFSDSAVPYLDYRLAENVFCRFFRAENLARACTSYDAKLSAFGIGIKTFILQNNQSSEKIAEFNKLKQELDPLDGLDLAKKLGEFRNGRIRVADDIHGTSSRIYHITGRGEGFLRIFNTPYDFVDISNIKVVKSSAKSLHFEDGINEYSFNRSKSVLMKRFHVNEKDFIDLPVEILRDPLSMLQEFYNRFTAGGIEKTKDGVMAEMIQPVYKKGEDYVILPLYSSRGGVPNVPEKSGLNQWNAGGRQRDPNEIYIPIPISIHRNYPAFFPPRDEHFALELPDGGILSAKVCQENSKALMSTHNADLGKWLLRKVMKKPEGELLTMNDLNRLGIDSVRIVNKHVCDAEGRKLYSISFMDDYESYAEFAGEE